MTEVETTAFGESRIDGREPKLVEARMRAFFAEYLMPNYLKKNAAYAQTDTSGDAFHNFRAGAKRYGMSEEQYWAVLWGKHVTAIETWVRTGKAPDHIWRILNDCATYCLIQLTKLAADSKIDWDEVMADGQC